MIEKSDARDLMKPTYYLICAKENKHYAAVFSWK